MELIKKYSHVIYIMIILLLIVMLLVKNKDLNKNHAEIEQLKVELESENNNEKEEMKDKNNEEENTFNEDLKWFVTKVYESNDRFKLYEDIKGSVNQNVLTALLGEDLPPDEKETKENIVERSVSDVDIFGKYANDGKYKAVVLLNVSYEFKEQEDTKKVLAYVEIQNEKGSWIITEFEEY